MTEIAYDPELPYVVEWQPGSVWARFHQKSDALEYVEREGGTFVDTTPKPKIPEGAEFITWLMNGANEVAIYVNFNPLKPWEWAGMYYSEENLLVEIGDAEVTVLVRKDET